MTAARKTPSQRGRRNRQRGQEFERELCAQFAKLLGTKITRKLGQERDSGCDIHVGKLIVEAKRRTSIGPVGKWLDQAEQGADRTKGQVPCVIARADKSPPVVSMLLEDFFALLTRAIVRGTAMWED